MKLRQQYFITLLLIGLLPIAILTPLSMYFVSNEIENTTINQLESIGNIQKSRLLDVFSGYSTELNLISSKTSLRNNLEAYNFNQSTTYLDTISNILDDILISDVSLLHISVTDPNATIISSTKNNRIGDKLDAYVTEYELTNSKVVRLLEGLNGSVNIELFSSLDRKDTILGYILLGLQGSEIVNTASDYSGLQDTGETLLGISDENGDAVFIVPLRFDNDAAFTRTISKDQDNTPIIIALQGKEDLLLSATDYRDIEVIALTRYIDDMGLGIVVKIDRDEIFSPINDIFSTVLITTISLSILLFVAVTFIQRQLLAPLLNLEKANKEIADGNYNTRVEVNGPEEIMNLQKSYNNMIDILVGYNALEESQKRLKQVNIELERFAYIVSHDLQEPLRIIHGFVEILEDEIDPDLLNEELIYVLEGIKANVQRQQRLIRDILMYSRVGRMNTSIEIVDLNEIVSEVSENLDMLIKDNNATLKVDQLPSLSTNKTTMIQIFQNIIGNAIKYRSAEDPVISISANEYEEYWKFTIEDNGKGIDPKYKDQIFDIFFTIGSKFHQEGTGIGLTICKKAIELNDGIIWAEPIDKGLRIHFTLPK